MTEIKNTDTDSINKCQIEELQEYALIDGSGLGEYIETLLNAYHSVFISDELKEFLSKELLLELQNFKENSQIIEEEQSYTRKIKYLQWDSR